MKRSGWIHLFNYVCERGPVFAVAERLCVDFDVRFKETR